MKLLASLVLATPLLTTTTFAEPYWVAWEGDDGLLPEQAGWVRHWGDRDGEFHGDGATRTLEAGILTYDDRADPWIYDISLREGMGNIDPDPGEVFVMEWRLKVEDVGAPWVGSIGLFSDDSWGLGLNFAEGHIVSSFEGLLELPIVPAVYHRYRVTSSDMRTYVLAVDNVVIHEGHFVQVLSESRVAWGSGSSGATASGLMYWDYFRYGVVPEPSALVLLLMAVACQRGRRAFLC